MTTTNHDITPFTLHVPEQSLTELTTRLQQTRWPVEDAGTGWDHGVPVGYAKELATYWAGDFDWRAQEQRINSFPQFTTPIDGHDTHFFHVRSEHEGATPLLLLHGWPGAPTEFLPMVAALVDPVSHGGEAADAFDVVIATIPGFGISGPAIGWNTDRAADAMVTLMARLGYDRYVVHGYDTGSLIGRTIGLIDAEHVVGLHLTDVLGGPEVTMETANSGDPREVRAAERAMRYEWELGGYAMVQSTRPQTLGLALTDSPVGLLTWLVERFHDWSAADEGPEEVLSRDEMLTTVSIYWHFATIWSSMRYYKEGATDWGAEPETSRTPLAIAAMPQDLGSAVPRTVEAANNLVRWEELAQGGHFAGWEQPDLMVADLRAAVRVLASANGS
ncbi:epoxide hydrolase family protein [Ornithinimicrobium faecis]|uniref:epoxide hydrolase family protein n=1 Tax=Ornithinimicrobium faecis TaxID=2934158 RepID=UPI0021193938|nr:epoxide hydrolase family protein [Ornithinimicrobium sp. HY1745]